MTKKTAIVTGAGSGIGLALADVLKKRDVELILADINEGAVKGVADRLGGTARVVDVGDAEAVQRLVDDVIAEHGHLDMIFNNAGIGAGGPVENIDLATWRQTIEIDLMGVIHGVAAAYPVMVRQKSGHIVNTASLAGLIPSPYLTPYAAAKHGVVGLSLTLRIEAAVHGVRVTAVCPGPVETPLLDVAGPVNARKMLTAALGEPYPADQLANDVLVAMDADQALVVAPETARVAWEMFKSGPEYFVGAMAGRAMNRPNTDG